jgi:hypothetical protein
MATTKRGTSCYACRLRKRMCNVIIDGPTRWKVMKKHPVDENESVKKYVGQWAKRSNMDKFLSRWSLPQPSAPPNRPTAPSTPSVFLIDGAPLAQATSSGSQSHSPAPNSPAATTAGSGHGADAHPSAPVEGFNTTPEINWTLGSSGWIGGSEPMHAALQSLATTWLEEERLPTNEQFAALLEHCRREHNQRELTMGQPHSHSNPREHAMTVMGTVLRGNEGGLSGPSEDFDMRD